jgi:hypothetical protein
VARRRSWWFSFLDRPWRRGRGVRLTAAAPSSALRRASTVPDAIYGAHPFRHDLSWWRQRWREMVSPRRLLMGALLRRPADDKLCCLAGLYSCRASHRCALAAPTSRSGSLGLCALLDLVEKGAESSQGHNRVSHKVPRAFLHFCRTSL